MQIHNCTSRSTTAPTRRTFGSSSRLWSRLMAETIERIVFPAAGLPTEPYGELHRRPEEHRVAIHFQRKRMLGCVVLLQRRDLPGVRLDQNSPGQTTTVDIGLHPGDHVLSVKARGSEGGCNTGILSAWGGTVRLDTADDVGPAPVKTPCKWSLNGGGNIMRGRDLRFTFESRQGNTPMGLRGLRRRSDSRDEAAPWARMEAEAAQLQRAPIVGFDAVPASEPSVDCANKMLRRAVGAAISSGARPNRGRGAVWMPGSVVGCRPTRRLPPTRSPINATGEAIQ